MSDTTVQVDTEAIAEVMRLSGTASPRAAAEAALREYIGSRRRTGHRVTAHGAADIPDLAPFPPVPVEG